MHRRAVIRQAIAALLGTLPSSPTVIVSRSALDHLPDLPSVTLVTGAEEAEEDTERMTAPASGEWPQHRQCEYTIECRVSTGAGGAVDDALDALALEVEQAVMADATLAGECDRIAYRGSDETEITEDLETPVGLRILTYIADYRVDARDPQALEA